MTLIDFGLNGQFSRPQVRDCGFKRSKVTGQGPPIGINEPHHYAELPYLPKSHFFVPENQSKNGGVTYTM